MQTLSFKNDSEFIYFCQNNSEIEEIHSSLQSISDAGFEEGLKHCQKLTKLKIICNDKITNEGLASVANHCTSLEKLTLFGLHKVNSEGCKRITQKNRNLSKLVVGDLPCVKNEFFDFIAKNSKISKLSVFLTYGFNVKGMEPFFKEQTSLRAITLIGTGFNDTNSSFLTNNLKDIKKISIRCSPVTNDFLQQVSEKGESIEEVKLTRTRVKQSFMNTELKDGVTSSYPNINKIIIRDILKS
jgi:hypothetical protein